MACVGYEPTEKLGNIHAGPGNEASWIPVHHTHNNYCNKFRQWFVTNYSSLPFIMYIEDFYYF